MIKIYLLFLGYIYFVWNNFIYFRFIGVFKVKVMGILYECLKEVRLEKYYEIFRINGIIRLEVLVRFDLVDCDVIGVIFF